MVLEILMFVLGLGLLVWGSSLFVDSAVALAKFLNLPEVLIGATIVSVGTTLPEVLFSSMAAAKGLTDMALGNAIGSILCNTGFIAGFLILLKPIELNLKEVKNVTLGAIFLGIGLLLYSIGGCLYGGLTRKMGVVLLIVCVIYIRNTVLKSADKEKKENKINGGQKFTFSDVVRLIMEAVAIYCGASMLVKTGPELARYIGVPEVIISLTLVALGTSLPELVTSLVSLKKNHSSLSLGNIIGADVLNFFLVGGLSEVICPAKYPKSIMRQELPFALVLLSIMCIPSAINKKAGRIQGILLLVVYALYLFLLNR